MKFIPVAVVDMSRLEQYADGEFASKSSDPSDYISHIEYIDLNSIVRYRIEKRLIGDKELHQTREVFLCWINFSNQNKISAIPGPDFIRWHFNNSNMTAILPPITNKNAQETIDRFNQMPGRLF